MNDTEKNEILKLADACIRESRNTRPEKLWLDGMASRFMEKHEISGKAELDALIFTRMYGRTPDQSDILKIRYWRTGRHIPSKREECLRFGEAMELSAREMQYLMQVYFDRCDLCFSRDEIRHPKPSERNEIYRKRIELMHSLIGEYLERIHPERMLRAGVKSQSLEKDLRYLYFADSLLYTENRSASDRTASFSYDAEFRRILRLEGEIPRRTMLRHLILLGNPFLNRRLLTERLENLGYCGLHADHTGVKEERTDAFLIDLLALYEKTCRGCDPQGCAAWLTGALRIADRYFLQKGENGLRFMHFKAQDSM